MHPNPNIGKPGMVGVGPGDNLRKKSFESLQKEVNRVVEYLKKNPSPDLQSIKGFAQHMDMLKKDVALYCGTFPEAKEYHDCYDRAVAIMAALAKLTDPAKLAAACKTEIPKLNRQVVYMAHATYFNPKVTPVAQQAPPRPASGPPPARPSSGPPKI